MKIKFLSISLPYLLLVSFYTGPFNSFDLEKIQAINESPYQGVAVPLIGAYDVNDYTYENFINSIKRMKKHSKKQIWPWVFLNRIMGYNTERGIKKANQDYFKKINILDIYNQSGALDDFYKLWRMALRISKELESPGIIMDIEAYNDWKVYFINYLSSELGMKKEEVIRRLNTIGRELADITSEEYPEAIIWFLFTGLPNNKSLTNIPLGILKQYIIKEIPLKVISGGEISLTYFSKSLEHLKTKIKEREENLSKINSQYPNHFMGGTIAPWDNSKNRKETFIRKKCRGCKFEDIHDFIPLIRFLLQAYDYDWIYAAAYAEYNPYNKAKAKRFNHAISIALKDVRK